MERQDLADLFSVFGPVSLKRVFSGYGVYAHDVCFALYLRGEIYFKSDETTIPQFVAEGCKPFSYAKRVSGKTVTVNSFWRLPERLYDDPDELAGWARAALTVALRLKAAKPPRKKVPSRDRAAIARPTRSAKPARSPRRQ